MGQDELARLLENVSKSLGYTKNKVWYYELNLNIEIDD